MEQYEFINLMDYIDMAIDQSRAVYEAKSINDYVFSIDLRFKRIVNDKYFTDKRFSTEDRLNGLADSKKIEREVFEYRFQRVRPILLFVSYIVLVSFLDPFNGDVSTKKVATIIFYIPIALILLFFLFPYWLNKTLVPEINKRQKNTKKQKAEEIVTLWEEQRSIALDRLNEAQRILQIIKMKDLISEKYFNLAALCSIRYYLRSGRCDGLTGENGAYVAYQRDKEHKIITEKEELFSIANEDLKNNQKELYKEIVKANRIVEAIKKEYDSCLIYMGKSEWEKDLFPNREQYFNTREIIEADYLSKCS